jgi:hypothetical protein
VNPPLPRRSPSSGLRIELEELVRLGLLRPTVEQAARGWRITLRLPPHAYPWLPRPPVRPIQWSGAAQAVVVWSRRGRAGRRLIGYCRRADAWTSGAREVFG